MTVWEYYSVKVSDPLNIDLLNKMGSIGWELVSVFCTKGEVPVAYFKRLKEGK